jgi:hypothetical protein
MTINNNGASMFSATNQTKLPNSCIDAGAEKKFTVLYAHEIFQTTTTP